MKRDAFVELRFCYSKLRDIRELVDYIDRFSEDEGVRSLAVSALQDLSLLDNYLSDLELAIEGICEEERR